MTRPRGSATNAVLALCDGSLTARQIAERTGLMPEYVRTVLQRNPEARVLRIWEKAKGKATPIPPMRGATYRAIRDRAEALKITYAEIACKLLSVAVEVGDLDTHFPIDEGEA